MTTDTGIIRCQRVGSCMIFALRRVTAKDVIEVLGADPPGIRVLEPKVLCITIGINP
jgi:hypothetical protein